MISKSLQRLVKAGQVKEEEVETILGRIAGFTNLQKAVEGVQLVIEAVPENLELKQKIFADLDRFCIPEAISWPPTLRS